MKMKLSIFVYITEQYIQGINKNHQECGSNFKHQSDRQEIFLLYMYQTWQGMLYISVILHTTK